ncbi:RING-H2 finger protein ATL7 [Ananas comosus]|uniref:RING-type E3 ubiquitin transferase n=1 Tax=Ananas comosus TaxID=4615 RepID=A0A199V417_ANACO|nr:RING-H2 finger protein ATL7 [Ananas comosus]
MSCTSPDPPAYCSAASPELKLYQAFIFSVPVFFTFVLLLVFYLFYLRRWRATNHLSRGDLQRTGIKKEVREMLPVIVFKESFLIRETQIPPCGHTFHVDCIDHWLATNTTCPLCRVSLLPTPKAAKSSPLHDEDQAVEEENSHEEYTERLTSERTAQHENETEEREADNTVGETEEVRHQGEASLVVNVDP